MMTINDLKELIQLIDQTSINEFQYQKDGYKIKINKRESNTEVVRTAAQVVPSVVQKENSETVSVQTAVEIVAETTNDSTASIPVEGKEVKSPLVGVFYSAPTPTSPPFVEIGKPVKKGDVLCIVEAMKVMNEIVAEQDGVITAVCVSNETLVEYGQPLVKIA